MVSVTQTVPIGNQVRYVTELHMCIHTHIYVVFSKLQCIIPTDELVYIPLKFYEEYLCICIIS